MHVAVENAANQHLPTIEEHVATKFIQQERHAELWDQLIVILILAIAIALRAAFTS